MKTLFLILVFAVATINAQMNVQGRVTCYGNRVSGVNIYANSNWCNGVYEQRQGRTDRNGYFTLSFPAQCNDLYVEAYSRYSVFLPQGWYFQFPNGAPSVVSSANFSCR